MFSYNFLHTGGSEISDWGLLQRLAKDMGYQVKHSRDYREIYQDRPDLILAQQYAIQQGVKIGAELGIPVIVTQHGPGQWGHANINNNYFLFNSHHLLKTELTKNPFQHYDVINPRIDCDKFRLSPPTDPEEPKPRFITFFGRPTKEKGIDLFIQLAKRISNPYNSLSHELFLCVGGNKDDIAKYVEQGKELNGGNLLTNLRFEEFTKVPEDVYKRTRLLLIPSQYESFGMVAIEASLCGIPVISTALPGIKEATNNRSNYVDSFDDVDMWEMKIREVLNNIEEQCNTAKEIGKSYQDRYEKQLDAVKYNIERLIDGKNPSQYTRDLTFTITISVYNRPEQVIRAMDSVRCQTYQDWELVIIDDCSTDQKTWQTLLKYDEEWGDNYKIKLVRNEVNRGTFYCRNVGIELASNFNQGNFVVNLDSDDLLIPTALERLRHTIIRNDAKVVQFKYYRSPTTESSIPTDPITLDAIAEDPHYIGNSSSSWGLFCVNREYLIDRVGYYDTIRYGADTEFMCRLKNFHQVFNLNQVLYYATDSPSGLSHQISQEWSNQYLRNFFKWYNDSKSNNTPIYMTFDRNPHTTQPRPFPLPQT